MNVFIPCENISESIQALDDARLIKQILECKVLLEGAIAYQKGEKPNGYFKHPVAQHYKDYPEFLWYYGYECCAEFYVRFDDTHRYEKWFADMYLICMKHRLVANTIIYVEGRKNTPECIRTTDAGEVYDLFKKKLIKKWKTDAEKGRPPKWTKRGCPEWAKGAFGNVKIC